MSVICAPIMMSNYDVKFKRKVKEFHAHRLAKEYGIDLMYEQKN